MIKLVLFVGLVLTAANARSHHVTVVFDAADVGAYWLLFRLLARVRS